MLLTRALLEPGFFFVYAFIMNIIFLGFSAVAALVITQSVGSVDKSLISSREVQIALVIEKVLENPNGKSLFEIQAKDSRFPQMVSTYLLERAAVLEAEGFSVGTPDEKEFKEALSKVEKAVSGKPYWKSLDCDLSCLKQAVNVKLVAQNFIKIKTESMTSIITDAEAQAYFERNRLKFGTAPFETFRDNIKAFLMKQQRQDRLRSWFEVLKKKYKVRNILLEDAKTPAETAHSQNKSG